MVTPGGREITGRGRDIWRGGMPGAVQSSMLGCRMKISLTLRLALFTGVIAAACLCWAASKPKTLMSYDPEAKALLAKMTLEEKIGQMTQPEQNELV